MLRKSALSISVLGAFAVAVVACSASSGKDKDFGAGGAGSTADTASGIDTTSSGLFDGGATGSTGSGSGCSEEASYIYTLAADNSLYRFDPPSLTFTLVGVLNCPTATASPYSMAVARDGTAWTIFTDGNLYKVDTTNAACTATNYAPNQHGWTTFGMGYSTDAPGSDSETLYVSEAAFLVGGMTKGLGKIDTKTMTLTPIGMYDQLSARAELTGTGDARLFGAFEGMPYIVSEIDKQNAKIKSQAPQTAINYAPDSSNFAFAFWGGDFYLFVGPGTSTDVFHYQPANKTTTKVKSVSYEIVGAGVSTCAPVTPPK